VSRAKPVKKPETEAERAERMRRMIELLRQGMNLEKSK
jgi:hypothetical protein